MTKVLVTGGAGFIGSNLANKLSEDYEVIAIDNLSLGRQENLNRDVRFINGDVRQISDFTDIECIFHKAAISTAPLCNKNPSLTYDVNVNGFVKVLEIARENDCKVVFASTSSLYAEMKPPHKENMNVIPIEHYTNSMFIRERISKIYSEMYGLDIIAFRYFSVYGKNEKHKNRFANILTQMIWKDEFIIFGDGSQTRDFIHISDVVNANLLAFKRAKGFKIYNVGTGIETTFSEAAKIIQKLKPLKITYAPNPIKRYVQRTCADVRLIKEELGFEPKVKLEDGIRESVGYYK